MNLNIGKCIYCGHVGPGLTREHILARGLGGNQSPSGFGQALVLQEATCEPCREITSAIEDHCLRSMMDYARARLGMKRKDRTAAEMSAWIDRDGTSEKGNVDSNRILGPVVLPSFYEAGLVSNLPRKRPIGCDYHVIMVASADESLMMETQADRLGVDLTCDSRIFAQMLAKIALGLAVARFGIDGFQPLIRNFILGEQEEYGYWVGGFATEIRPQFAQYWPQPLTDKRCSINAW